MKLHMIIPSRGRIRQLAAALSSLRACESQDNQIMYGVCCDDDDAQTLEFCRQWQDEMPLAVRCGPRPESLGALDNEMAVLMGPADAYGVYGDDMVCITPGWDAVIAKALQETPYGVFWWTQKDDSITTVPIISKAWHEASGRLFTNHFPFWYDDLWLCELWMMATDQELLTLPIKLVDCTTKTTRMRELAFWHNFYARMRVERVREAEAIAVKLGLPVPVMGRHALEALRGFDNIHPDTEQDVLRRNKAESTPPDDAYNRAKERAVELMRIAA